MVMTVFDDYPNLFYPASLTRCVGDIRCGILKLRQRLQAAIFSEENVVVIDPGLESLYKERHPDWIINAVNGDALFVNSRLRYNPSIIQTISSLQPQQVIRDEQDQLVALRTVIKEMVHDFAAIEKLASNAEVISVGNVLYNSLADVIMDNGRLIDSDFRQFFQDEDNYMETELGVTVLNPYQVWIGEGAMLKPGVVLDATHGPVVIDENAEVMAHAVIMGPCYIGKNSKVKVGAKIYENTSIGPVCKIGGEVEGSIIQAYSNKQHDGFLGHAYLGEWVNLGAGTNNSDLKNNYKNVSFYSYAPKAKVDSTYQFLGSMIGDHSKTGINSTLNTGVVIGMGANLWGSGLISGYVPSYTWGEAGSYEKYDFQQFIQTAKIVKQRRNLTVTDNETEVLRQIIIKEQQEQ